jgi:hypothetical protein
MFLTSALRRGRYPPENTQNDSRVSTGLENPGKSLNWKKKFQDWKVLENQ